MSPADDTHARSGWLFSLHLCYQEEQHKLKKELAELAITLNMEAQKGRVQRFENEK